MTTTYRTSAAGSAAPHEALQSAVKALTNNGFAITHAGPTSATLTGPGLTSTKQNPLLGASTVDLELDRNTLVLHAELGGVDSLTRFLMRFPLLLGLGLGLLFGVLGLVFGQLFGIRFGVPWARGWLWMGIAIGGCLLPVSPWLILSPMMAQAIRRRTQKALETVVNNARYAGGQA